MKLTFRSKIVVINLALVLFTMLFLSFIVIQGLIHYNIESAQKRLSQYSNEAVLYIQQEIIGEKPSPEKYEATLLNKSLSIAETLSNISYTRLLLYDAKGKLITDSANVEVANDLEIDREISIALKLPKGKSVLVYKKIEDLSRIYSATPIYIDDVQIGVIAFIYSLESLDIIISQVITLFIVSSLISMIILFILSNYLVKSILKPIRLLVDSTKKVSLGHSAELIEYGVNDEIGELTSNFNQMILNISNEVTKIEEEKHKLSAIISSIHDGIIAVSLENSILLVNEKAKEILNLKDSVITPTSLNAVPFITELIQEVTTEKNEIIKEIDFSKKHLLLFATLIINNERSLGILVVIRDITKLYVLEKQQKQFVSNVSHELRTPLTTIIGYTDLLQRRGTDNVELLNKSIDTINREGKRLLRLVEDLLSMSKYDQLDFNLVFTSVNINTLLEDVISQMKIKSQKYDVDINYNVLELPSVRGDYDRLKQVFINIIDNSIKYSNHDDIINVVATHYENYVEVSIRDYGPGIPEKDLARIFDAFYRVDENRSREFGGTGLGLSIVKSIVGRHHGQVHVESKDNEGTMVVVKLLKENSFT